MNKNRVQIGPLQMGIIALTLAAALIHLVVLGIRHSELLFMLNGLGYLALLGALYLPLSFLNGYRHLARWALMGYALITIIAWAVVSGNLGPLEIITKAIEAAIIILLWIESRSVAAMSPSH